MTKLVLIGPGVSWGHLPAIRNYLKLREECLHLPLKVSINAVSFKFRVSLLFLFFCVLHCSVIAKILFHIFQNKLSNSRF